MPHENNMKTHCRQFFWRVLAMFEPSLAVVFGDFAAASIQALAPRAHHGRPYSPCSSAVPPGISPNAVWNGFRARPPARRSASGHRRAVPWALRSRKRAYHLPWLASDVYSAFCAGEQEVEAVAESCEGQRALAVSSRVSDVAPKCSQRRESARGFSFGKT